MILPLHITIALASIVVATAAFIAPSTSKLRVSYALTALTLLSGTYLAFSAPAHIVQTCISGILYTSIVTALVVFAHRKLVATK